MKESDMKVFHGLVNYGTQAGLFAKSLRSLCVEAYSASYEDLYARFVDEQLVYSDRKLMRIFQKFFFFYKKVLWFFHFNIFHFYFGRSLFYKNIDLYFYKIFGKKVVMEYLGTDCDLWLGLNGVDWRGRPINRADLCKKLYKQAKLVDKQLVCAPVYYQFVDNSVIVPLALDLKDYEFVPFSGRERLVFMHCPTNRQAKKSDEIEAALNKLKQEGYNFGYKCITNVTHAQLKEEYKTADVVIDQLNHWYGTVSIEAMALGKVVVAGYYPHLCLYDDRYADLPIINANTKNIYEVLKTILDGEYDLNVIGKKSREFAMKTHNLEEVTKQLIDIYKDL